MNEYGKRWGVIEGMPRVMRENYQQMIDNGWIFVKNIPRWQGNPFYHYSESELLDDPCLGEIERYKDEFGELNVTCGVPVKDGKIVRIYEIGLYIRPDIDLIETIVAEWEQIPSIRSKVLDVQLDRWLEANG